MKKWGGINDSIRLFHLVIYYEMIWTPTQMPFEAAHSVPVFERESRAGVFGVEHLHVFWQRVLLAFLCVLLILRLHFLSRLHVFWETHKGWFKHSTVSTAQITPSQQEDKQSLTVIHAGLYGTVVADLGVMYQCWMRFQTLVSWEGEHHMDPQNKAKTARKRRGKFNQDVTLVYSK